MISTTKEIDLDQLNFCLGRASWKSGFNTVLFQCILEDCYCKQKHHTKQGKLFCLRHNCRFCKGRKDFLSLFQMHFLHFILLFFFRKNTRVPATRAIFSCKKAHNYFDTVILNATDKVLTLLES